HRNASRATQPTTTPFDRAYVLTSASEIERSQEAFRSQIPPGRRLAITNPLLVVSGLLPNNGHPDTIPPTEPAFAERRVHSASGGGLSRQPAVAGRFPL